jgi:6-phosphogluconolactonase
MVIDPTSSWLIMAYQGSTEIDALPLDPTTGLPTSTTAFTATSTFAVPAPGGPRLAITPSSATNPQIYVALGTGGTEAIGFNASATTGNGPFGSTGVGIKLKSANSSDTAVAIDPTSTYVFITEANIATTPTAGLLRVFKTADLTTDLSNEPATGIGPSAVLSDLTGAFVYVTNSTDGTISGYTFDTTTQTLTAVGTTPTEAAPVGIIEDNSKTYIIDVGSGANPNLWLYSFDSAGGGVLDVNSTTSTAATNPAVANGIAATH